MRHLAGPKSSEPSLTIAQRSDWRVIRDLLPYLLE